MSVVEVNQSRNRQNGPLRNPLTSFDRIAASEAEKSRVESRRLGRISHYDYHALVIKDKWIVHPVQSIEQRAARNLK
ncbi:unnamed protein product [Fusarium venenatum]|uniref:Uncharacterized protein n=1 Tax=Fusarium venenatum TaxID=56646 RepID=A0A2L2TVV1_9HYPO|nr:LOW QUALITY PROTEIN: uncharacterized protein FVRRES_01077 [Fusarium venenatum]CEI64565.1 unnamed protein product [Fusarium venenatum]